MINIIALNRKISNKPKPENKIQEVLKYFVVFKGIAQKASRKDIAGIYSL